MLYFNDGNMRIDGDLNAILNCCHIDGGGDDIGGGQVTLASRFCARARRSLARSRARAHHYASEKRCRRRAPFSSTVQSSTRIPLRRPTARPRAVASSTDCSSSVCTRERKRARAPVRGAKFGKMRAGRPPLAGQLASSQVSNWQQQQRRRRRR